MILTELPQVKLAAACCVELGAWWKGTRYTDDLHRIYWFENGKAWMSCNGRRFVMRPGRLYFFPARSVLDFGCRHDTTQHYIHFKSLCPQSIPLDLRLPLINQVNVDDEDFVAKLFSRLEVIDAKRDEVNNIEQQGILLQILGWFVGGQCVNIEKMRKLQRFHRVLAYIENNIDGDLSVSKLSYIANLERSHFTKLFKVAIGMPPSSYIRNRKIELSMQCLRLTDEALEAIASKFGFCDAFHFSRTFKAITGISPSTYRNMEVAVKP